MLTAVITLAGLGIIASLGLGLAARVFAVRVDPRLEKLFEIIPNVNCGGCGYPGCSAFCEGLLKGEAEINDCVVGDAELSRQIASILGVDYAAAEKRVATIRCQGMFSKATYKYDYKGVATCRANQMVDGGHKECTYGCLGFGDCLRACPFGAMELVDGLSRVNEDLCTACGNCVRACPRHIIEIHPTVKKVMVLCCSHDKGGVVRKICTVGCIGCKKCVKTCPFEAIDFENFKSTIDWVRCTNCGLCATVCPTHAIVDACTTPVAARQLAREKIEKGELQGTCPMDHSAEGVGEPHVVEGFTCTTCGARVDLDALGAPLIAEAEELEKRRKQEELAKMADDGTAAAETETEGGTA